LLYTLCQQGKYADGEYPTERLIADANGNLYGIRQNGVANGVGAVFEVTPAGIETVL